MAANTLRLAREPVADSYRSCREPPVPGFPRKQFQELPLSFVLELYDFIRTRRKFWLIPIIIMMAVLGGVVVLTKGSAVAPFIYTLF